jgi:hypothetical protein
MIDWEIKKPFSASGTILRVVGSASQAEVGKVRPL